MKLMFKGLEGSKKMCAKEEEDSGHSCLKNSNSQHPIIKVPEIFTYIEFFFLELYDYSLIY